MATERGSKHKNVESMFMFMLQSVTWTVEDKEKKQY